jgi:hypothetical protein
LECEVFERSGALQSRRSRYAETSCVKRKEAISAASKSAIDSTLRIDFLNAETEELYAKEPNHLIKAAQALDNSASFVVMLQSTSVSINRTMPNAQKRSQGINSNPGERIEKPRFKEQPKFAGGASTP